VEKESGKCIISVIAGISLSVKAIYGENNQIAAAEERSIRRALGNQTRSFFL
jgi:hypothetical protein